MEKKKIELTQLKGILVDKNDMQIGARIFGYDTTCNLLCFYQVGNNDTLHTLGMTNDLLKAKIIENKEDFEDFLSKAKDYSEKYCCTY